MSLYLALFNKYGYNEPILLKEIKYKEYSKPWIYKELNKLCDEGSLIKYEKGVYYIPTQTALGPSKLNPRKVIEKKYINDGEETIGYYSGATFMNQIGLSTQMPNTIEIYTNNETSQMRRVTVGNQKIIIRKARIAINAENVKVLSFLELMNSSTPDFLNEEKKQLLYRYIIANGISRSLITKYVSVFPDKAIRTLVESEVIYNVAP